MSPTLGDVFVAVGYLAMKMNDMDLFGISVVDRSGDLIFKKNATYEHEEALVNAIARLKDVSEGESGNN
ncbi:hypothetical protein E2542_SST28299 [Spatholobus suberectus]|nr:hypothetical protein E2542_SST28299 [Spatholobus suberectus]